MKQLVDSLGRRAKKLRLNLLDACNMRCMYCMPENASFKSAKGLLSPLQTAAIVANLAEFGIEEVKLTGGEPLIHPQFKQIVVELGKCGLKKISVTTNGIKLEENLDFLAKNNVTSVNVSLDSLQKESFAFITKTQKLDQVLSGILSAKKRGFLVKTNTVMLKNINFEEIEAFLEFGAKNDIETRFLELMKIGMAMPEHHRHFVSAQEAINRISRQWELAPLTSPKDSTSFRFIASRESASATIGFIASETRPFCGDCSRLRLSNEGNLRPCIMINEGPNLHGLPIEEYETTLVELIEKKPSERLYGNPAYMNEIGG